MTDYHARALNIRVEKAKGKDDKDKDNFVHMVNSTLCATERTLCCLIENYQTESGVLIPEVLQPYMGGIEFVPFKKI